MIISKNLYIAALTFLPTCEEKHTSGERLNRIVCKKFKRTILISRHSFKTVLVYLSLFLKVDYKTNAVAKYSLQR